MSYDKYPGFHRVSAVADSVERLSSDGLMYVGATWAAQRALEITIEILDGVISPDVQAWMDWSNDPNPLNYLKSDWFADSIKAGATRMLQAAADRGTITNNVWDALNRGDVTTVNDATDFALQDIEMRGEESKLSRMQWQEAVDMGLVDPKDKNAKPVRNYQCSEIDVIPFVVSLTKWFIEDGTFGSKECQKFLVDEKRKVVGTCDDIGTWGDMPVVLDLKTSTSPQPKRGARAQVAQYWRMLGSKPDIRPMLLIVTKEKVCPRIFTDKGIKAGLKDFDLALDALNNSSMAECFLTSKQSTVKI
jgi:hypothetical protein